MKNERIISVLCTILLLAQSSIIAFCQFNRTKNWVFGDSLHVSFNTSTPSVSLSSLKSLEGASSISDTLGNLLFYTNGITVWNAQHQVMPNGTGLWANLSTTNAALIVPMPNHSNLYYIFVISAFAAAGSLSYSIVDMNLDGGLGDITTKNEVLFGNSTEKLCATKHANNKDYWIMTHDYGNNTFRAFLLTSQGVHQEPVLSEIGEQHIKGLGQGSMRFSPSGCKLAMVQWADIPKHVEAFDFDNTTGEVFNPIGLYTADIILDQFYYEDNLSPYSLCFSTNNKKLYITSRTYVAQFDLTAQDIQASRELIESTWSSSYGEWIADIQIASNGKVYISRAHSDYMSVINYPNNTGAACGFQPNAISLIINYTHQTKNRFGLPNFVSNFLVPDGVIFETCPKPIVKDTFFVEIPNVFTPNGDGQNDVFSIQQVGTKEILFVIYNRWGNIVHRTSVNPSQKDVFIWDGGNASDGTYFYTATFLDTKDKIVEKKGFIHLVK